MDLIKIVYFRDSKRFPVGCAAYTVSQPDDLGSVVVKFGASAHNRLDDFNKSVAQDLTVGRLIRNPTSFSVSLDVKASHKRFAEIMIAVRVSENKKLNSRVRKAAHRYITDNWDVSAAVPRSCEKLWRP